MSVVKRFLQIAQIVGVLVILAGVAGAGTLAYLWWDSRQETETTEIERDVTIDDTAAVTANEDGTETSAD